MTRNELLRQIEELVEVPTDTLAGTEPLRGIGGWTSLAVVGFIAMIDEQFGMTLSAEKINAARIVNDLVALVGDRVAEDAA